MSEENELPRGWELEPLASICQVERGITFPASAKSNQFFGENIACLRTANVQESVDWDDLIYVPRHFVKDTRKLLFQNDILISMANSRELVGKVSFVDSLPIVATFGGFIAALRASEVVQPRFLFYFLRTSTTQHKLRATASQTVNIANLSLQGIYSLIAPLPPLPEQQRIVAAIEQQFSRLDAGVAALRQAKEKLKRYRAAVLKAAVEGKLTEAWRTEHPTTEHASKLLERVLAERRAKWEADLRAKGKDSAKVRYVEPKVPEVEGLPELPEGWCWVSLEAVSSIQLGKMLSPKAYEHGLLQMPYLRNENVRWGSIDYRDVKKMGFKESELEKYRLEPYDLLICEGGEAGRCAVYTEASGQFLYQKALHRVRAKSEVVSPYFVQFCMQYYVASKIVIPRPSETTIQHLPLEKIQVLPFPLPPLVEQEQIVSEVEQRLSIVSELEATVEANLKRAERLRQSILKEAFAGRLVPQDPSDEPASVLLERIRGERDGRRNGKVDRKAVESVVIGEAVDIDVKEVRQVGLWEGVGG